MKNFKTAPNMFEEAAKVEIDIKDAFHLSFFLESDTIQKVCAQPLCLAQRDSPTRFLFSAHEFLKLCLRVSEVHLCSMNVDSTAETKLTIPMKTTMRV